MNVTEAGKLIALAGTFDRFIVLDEFGARAWQAQLHDVAYDAAERAVMDFYRDWDGKRQLTISYILDEVGHASRKSAADIAADVTTARARKLVPYDWPETQPIPAEALAIITAARNEARDQARGWRELEEAK